MFRTMSGTAIAAAVGIAFPGSVVAQDNGLVLEPTSPWGLEMAEDSCALRRIYSDGTHSAVMEMRQFSPGVGMRIMVRSEDLETDVDDFSYRFLPDSEDREYLNVFTITLNGGGEGVIFNGSVATAAQAALREDGEQENVYAADEVRAREAEITGLSLPNSFEEPITIQTGPLAAPMEAMRGCMDDLMTSWGLDLEAHQTLSRPVQPVRQEQWTRRFAQAYPRAALVRGEQAALQVRLIIDAEGGVQDCFVQSGIGMEVFNETACERLQRFARFEPALDANGNPIVSYWTTSIMYSMR